MYIYIIYIHVYICIYMCYIYTCIYIYIYIYMNKKCIKNEKIILFLLQNKKPFKAIKTTAKHKHFTQQEGFKKVAYAVMNSKLFRI